MTEKVRLGSVGLGRWARVLARAAARSDVVEISSCFSRSEAKRQEFAEEFGILNTATSYEELLANPDIEGVVITTPNDTHREVILQAIDAGKPTYTDKPIASTMEDAVAIAAKVEESALPFAVGHSARRLSGHRQMKAWINDGRVGQVSMIESNFSNERGLHLTSNDWRWYKKGSPGGPLIQLGVHHADTLQCLLGPVKSVAARMKRLYTSAEIPDATMCILEFESGPLGYLGCGWASPGLYTTNILGTKTNMFYELDFSYWHQSQSADKYSTLQFSEGSGRDDIDLPPTDMFREQLEEFGLATRGEAAIEVGSQEALRALAVVYAGLESAESRAGAAVDVSEVIEKAREPARG